MRVPALPWCSLYNIRTHACSLQSTVESVSTSLEVGMQEAGRIVQRCPVLVLREPTFPVARRVALLGALLPVSGDKLRQVLRQRPLLLSKSLQVRAGGPRDCSARGLAVGTVLVADADVGYMEDWRDVCVRYC